MLASRFIAETFAGHGISHAFFVDSILRRSLVEMDRLGIQRVLAHSEKSAAYMADGYARVSGRPALCMAQSVGGANLAAGLQDAYLHRSPVLAVTGRKGPMFRNRSAYQEIDHGRMFDPVTKFRAEVETAAELPILLEQAFRALCTGTPRPVHLDLAGLSGEIVETGEVDADVLVDPRHRAYPAHRAAPDPEAITVAAAMLRQSQRPIIVAGAGAIQSGAHEAILRLAERLAIPVATSTGGRGIMATTHPLHVGTIGTYSAPPANRILDRADLVIVVGSYMGDQQTTDWTIPAPQVAKIQIDVDAAEIGRNYLGTHAIPADPRRAVEALSEAVCDVSPFGEWSSPLPAELASWRDGLQPLSRSDATPIAVERLCAELTGVLPEDAILVADTGYSAMWTSTLVDLASPRQSYLRAAGSLGWAFPAALGAKCAAPDRPVVCFCGDGALGYHIADLETARRRGLAVVVVVNNNSAFGQGKQSMSRLPNITDHDVAEILRFVPCDFARIAEGFGVKGMRVEHAGDLAGALHQAMRLGEPVVIDVVTDFASAAPTGWRRA